MKKVAIPMVSEISPLYVFARVSLIYPLKQLLGHTQLERAICVESSS